jgi:galactokinase
MGADELISRFIKIYGESQEEILLFFAPGRVNLIGEHTDYNNGFVMPCALSFGTYVAVRHTKESRLDFHSDGFSFTSRVPLQDRYMKEGNEWINYPVGVIEMFAQKGFKTKGLEFFFYGNIPPAAGLSSSASIEMAVAFALNDLYNWGYTVLDLIHLCREAENEFVGVSCGIMDQFAVGQGKAGHAVFLDCGSLNFEHVPLNIPGYRLVIINTNKKRGLGDSKYNERVRECSQAVGFLSQATGINSLGEISSDNFAKHSQLIASETTFKRARHVVSENGRVLNAVKALKDNNYHRFGELMIESHASLRDDYEVTGFELDSLVEIALEQQGVLGARMTGAGFGGCSVAFVKDEYLDAFISNVEMDYQKKTGLKAGFYLPEIGDGVMKIK